MEETTDTQGKSKLGQLREKIAGQSKVETPTEAQQIAELTDSLKRLQADFINFRRRTDEESRFIKKRAIEDLLNELMGVADNFELAIKQVPKEEQNEFYKGIKIIFSQFVSILESQGLEKIPNQHFDAHMHEAIVTEASDKPKGEIIEVLHQGYILGGKVLRTSKVKISSGEKNNE